MFTLFAMCDDIQIENMQIYQKKKIENMQIQIRSY